MTDAPDKPDAARWTAVPPVNGGLYWVRNGAACEIAEVVIIDGREFAFFSADADGYSFYDLHKRDWLWWPISLTPPS
jgi:hypothetical protein